MFDNLQYAFDEIRKNYDDRYWWRMRFENRIVGPVQQHVYGNDGVDVMSEDWDNLLVLDACRADVFEEAIEVESLHEYMRVKSKASATPEWMERNFRGRKFGDTVYVSGNPWISKIARDSFHAIENIWLDEYDVLEEDLANVDALGELGLEFDVTISASKVNKRALEVAEEHADKRIIVHYFQPHAPYIGRPDGTEKAPAEITGIHPGEPLARGNVRKKDVWNEYRDNLEYVWHHARQLLDDLRGRSVVTSDHGELFGEWLIPFPLRGYAHPIGLRLPAIVDIPWAVFKDERREIVEGGTRASAVEQDVVEERLRDLGYTA